MLKVLVGHQVASPRVSNLVGYHIGQRFVASLSRSIFSFGLGHLNFLTVQLLYHVLSWRQIISLPFNPLNWSILDWWTWTNFWAPAWDCIPKLTWPMAIRTDKSDRSHGISFFSVRQSYVQLTSSLRSVIPPIAEKCLAGSPCNRPIIFRSTKTVKPSLSQKCSKFLLVTRLPVQECAISWAITSANDLSPAWNDILRWGNSYIKYNYPCIRNFVNKMFAAILICYW